MTLPCHSLRPLSLCNREVSLTTASGLFPYEPWRCALQQPQASFPMHHGGVPYNNLRPPYASWRCALHPQASLCVMEVCLTTASGLLMHHEVTATVLSSTNILVTDVPGHKRKVVPTMLVCITDAPSGDLFVNKDIPKVTSDYVWCQPVAKSP